MGDSRNILIKLFLIVFIFCTLIYAVSAQENETKDSIQQEAGITTTLNETISDLSQNTDGDSTIEIQSNFDKSLDIFNVVATLLGVLVTILAVIITVLAVIIAIVGGLGFLEIRKWREIRTNIDEDVTVIKETRHKAEDYLYKLRNDTKIQISSLNEKPSGDVMKNLDDFASRLELLEIMGASLKSEDYFNRATDLYFKGEYELALKSIEKAIELKPDYTDAWVNKNVLLGDLGRHELALISIEKAIELKPDYTDAWSNKGITLGNLNRHELALKAFEKVIELEPGNSKAWDNKSYALHSLGRHELALKSIEKSIELEPKSANAWYNYAHIYYSVKSDKEKALSFLRQAIEIGASYKDKSKEDKDFENLWADDDFKKLTE